MFGVGDGVIVGVSVGVGSRVSVAVNVGSIVGVLVLVSIGVGTDGVALTSTFEAAVGAQLRRSAALTNSVMIKNSDFGLCIVFPSSLEDALVFFL